MGFLRCHICPGGWTKLVLVVLKSLSTASPNPLLDTKQRKHHGFSAENCLWLAQLWSNRRLLVNKRLHAGYMLMCGFVARVCFHSLTSVRSPDCGFPHFCISVFCVLQWCAHLCFFFTICAFCVNKNDAGCFHVRGVSHFMWMCKRIDYFGHMLCFPSCCKWWWWMWWHWWHWCWWQRIPGHSWKPQSAVQAIQGNGWFKTEWLLITYSCLWIVWSQTVKTVLVSYSRTILISAF